MKNLTAIIGIAVLVLAAMTFVFSSSGSAEVIDKAPTNQEAQIVKLSLENGNYVLSPSTFKKDVPVKIEADVSTMPGCSKAVVISAFNARKNLNENDNVIEFTPNKAGTFNIACSMNMYQGSFTVLENDGTKSNYVEQKLLATGSSCGMAGGGCGCGGGI